MNGWKLNKGNLLRARGHPAEISCREQWSTISKKTTDVAIGTEMGCAVSRLDDKNRPPITILLTRFQRDISQHLVGSSRRSNVELTVDQCESDSDTSETRLNINVYDANSTSDMRQV